MSCTRFVILKFLYYILLSLPILQKAMVSSSLIVLVDCAFLETKEAEPIYACTLPLI